MRTLLLTYTAAPLEEGVVLSSLRELLQATYGFDVSDPQVRELEARIRFAPHVATLATLALYDLERDETILYSTKALPELPGVRARVLSETDMLQALFAGLPEYTSIVTFKGSVDFWPLVLHRSLQLAVPLPRPLPIGTMARQPWHRELVRELGFPIRSRRSLLAELGVVYAAAAPTTVPALDDLATLRAIEAFLRHASGEGEHIDF